MAPLVEITAKDVQVVEQQHAFEQKTQQCLYDFIKYISA